jgi:hypothetical protein
MECDEVIELERAGHPRVDGEETVEDYDYYEVMNKGDEY